MRANLPDGTAVEWRRDLTLELLPGERIELPEWRAAVDMIEGPEGVAPDLANGVVLHEVGRYWLRAGRDDLNVVCVDPAVIDRINQHARPVGHGAVSPRGVVRNLCNCAAWFDGTLSCLMTGEPSRSLAQFGG